LCGALSQFVNLTLRYCSLKGMGAMAMTQQVASIVLASWGAFLSTGLAIIKVWELWRDRVRLTTSYSFTTDSEGGNEIIIENPTKTPVMISYWELLWLKRNWLKAQVTDGKFPDEGYCEITLGGHSRHKLIIQHLVWGREAITKGKLYLRLHIVGRRKPVLLKVYDPSK
jgi:hypothetical protein